MPNVCVFTGSTLGDSPSYREAAVTLGEDVARRGWGLVYGGGTRGLMGVVAAAAVGAGGQVVGVHPGSVFTLEEHPGVEVEVVDSMGHRKQTMSELAQVFVALPGGTGTLDEISDVLTWAQIGLISTPIGLVDTDGFYRPFLACYDHMIAEGFVRPEFRALLTVDPDPVALLDKLGVTAV